MADISKDETVTATGDDVVAPQANRRDYPGENVLQGAKFCEYIENRERLIRKTI